MSALIHFKHIVLNAVNDPRLKTATLDLINAIDSDLEEQGYEHSSNVDEAIAKFDEVIMTIDEESNPTPALAETSTTDDEDEDEGETDLLGGFNPTDDEEEDG